MSTTMTAIVEAVDVTVHEEQVRVAEAEAVAALHRVLGRSAIEARARLRLGPGRTCEPLARVLDRAFVVAGKRGLDPAALVLAAGSAVAAEDIVRIRRKAHGVADWISSPTSDVTVVLRPAGLAAVAAVSSVEPLVPVVPEARNRPEREPVVETEAELAVREALYDVIDPDLGVNVVDLGFVRQIRIDAAGVAHLVMTLTSAACPLTEVMARNVRAVLAEDGTDFDLEWEWLPAWKPADITPDGREQLQAIGFSAF
ncbi:iron-sulfur cluster assembly protein [Nocardioides sp. NPDC059952]|uniref:iron-sulfur cluster assembly protein n=1 Tax=Nocardioides sp. NPDC059952 TaxID=3347014 RepID=UPI00365D5892